MTRRCYSATEIARLGYCEAKIVMDARHGARTTVAQDRARKRGIKEHERFHAEVTRNRAGPCFIASVACGPQHPTTRTLRRFRDSVLRRTALGRRLVGIYYRTSPPIAAWLKLHPRAARATGSVLDAAARIMSSKGI